MRIAFPSSKKRGRGPSAGHKLDGIWALGRGNKEGGSIVLTRLTTCPRTGVGGSSAWPRNVVWSLASWRLFLGTLGGIGRTGVVCLVWCGMLGLIRLVWFSWLVWSRLVWFCLVGLLGLVVYAWFCFV